MVLATFRAHFSRGIAGLDRFTADLGTEIFNLGGVGPVTQSAPGVFHAAVSDPAGGTFQTTIHLSAHGALSRLSTTCSCSVGTDCAHGAAVLMAWLKTNRSETSGPFCPAPTGSATTATAPTDDDAPQPPPVLANPSTHFERLRALSWMRSLRDLPTAGGDVEPPPSTQTFWVLDEHAQPPTLTAFRNRRSTGGEVLPPEPCRPPFDQPAAIHAGWDEADLRAIRLLAGASAHQATIALTGAHARDALLGLIDAGKVYLDEPIPWPDRLPLQRGAARPTQLIWRTASPPETANLQLSLAIEPSAHALLLSHPCWLERQTRTLGPLSPAPPPALIEWLRQAPPISPTDANEVAHVLHALRRSRPTLLELLPNVPGTQLREQRGCPTPILRLFALTPPTSGRCPSGTALLAVSCAMEYQGRRIEPLRSKTVSIRDELGPLLLHCDHAHEEQALEYLRQSLSDLAGPGETLTMTRSAPSAAARGHIESGWCTIATLPADSIAAARLRNTVLPSLRALGWTIEDREAAILNICQGEQLAITLTPIAPPSGQSADDHRSGTWFTLQASIQVNHQCVDLAPLLTSALSRGDTADWLRGAVHDQHVWWRLTDHDIVRIAAQRLVPLIQAAADWIDTRTGAPSQAVRLPAQAALSVADLFPECPEPEILQTLRVALEHCAHPDAIDPPTSFTATLRPYQRVGLGWLQKLAHHRMGGILADDMGLGKTVQVLAHLATEHAAGRLLQPTLVIAPTSVIFNWQREAARHAPQLRVLAFVGPDRRNAAPRLPQQHIVLTSWALLPRDADILLAQHWQGVIADEAHIAKNTQTRVARVLRHLKAPYRLALTGTPLENHLGELWSIMHFAVPGLLGSEAHFRARFRQPIERGLHAADSHERLRTLEQRLQPFVLRRTKAAVLTELPPCTEIIHRVELSGAQRELYDALRALMDARVRSALQQQGRDNSRMVVLDALLKMRQACCDPSLIKLPQAQRVQHSAKLAALRELLLSLTAVGRRVLVFSQFTAMLDRIEHALDADPQLKPIPRTRLDGQTHDRSAAVAEFQEGHATIFLLSLKAGGVGLNLTRADTVIHFDPWWNPAVEAQATDRAHRIGQHKPVFVYKLITTGTIEERILTLQARKAQLAHSVLHSHESLPTLSTDDYLDLLQEEAASA